MSTSLLTTKLHIPSTRPELVLRPRLIQQLEDGIRQGHRLTLVSAPAGYGKTTLVSEWASRFKRFVAWISLDKGDNEPIRFVTFLLAALQTIDENVGQVAQSMLGAPQLPPVERLVTTLINDLASVPEPFTLVLDDYHNVQLKWIHEVIKYLILHQPKQMHLILCTREDPPLPLPRLRVCGQVTEIRADDLQFTIEETAEFINNSLGRTLENGLITLLDNRTTGWVAGLQMAVLSMQRRSPEEIAEFIASFSGNHRYMIDYMADEVLSQQPKEIREFLIQTSILDRLTAPLCDAVTGRKGSEAIIRQLERTNLFLVPMDDERQWYRYHPLFADFLRSELDMDRQADLHMKATKWLANHGLLLEAVHHAFASGDMNEAVRMIRLAVDGALRSGSFSTLSSWLDALPQEMVQASSELATYKGFLLYLTRQFAEATTYTDYAERNLQPDSPPFILGRVLSLKAHDALCHGKLESVVELAQEALDYLDDGDDFFLGQTLNILGQVLQTQGDIAGAAEVYHQAVLTSRQKGDQRGVSHVLINLVATLNELGQRQNALALCQQAIEECAAQPDPPSPWINTVYLALGLLSYEANELDLARDQILRALDVSRQMNFNNGLFIGSYFLAQVYLARREIDEMLNVIHDIRQFAVISNLELPYELLFTALEAQASLQQGNLAGTLRWVEEANLTLADTPHPLMEFAYFVYVRLLLAQKRPQDAQILLSTIEHSAREGGRLRKLITIYILQALAQQALGHNNQAISLIEEAIHLAAPQGYLRAFLNEGGAIMEFLQKARDHLSGAVALDFIVQVHEVFRMESAVAHGQALIEKLSEREMQVLRLLTSGLSSTEVANELFIAVGTARTHIKNIYRKLNVHRRSEAIRRAQELKLV